MNVGRRVYFAKGSSVVSDEAKMTLQNQAKWLKDNRKWLVKVQGHADDPGSEAAQKHFPPSGPMPLWLNWSSWACRRSGSGPKAMASSVR